jgi:hypothetical protein
MADKDDNGSSRWNGNYGETESKRRSSYNSPRKPWTSGEQEFTRHPSKEWGYAGTGKRAGDEDK